MRIAVIGAGNVGGALTRKFTRAGHEVLLVDHDPKEAVRIAEEIGATAVADPIHACTASDVIVLAVPFARAAEGVCRSIEAAARGKVVVDAMNPLNEDYSGLVTDGGVSAAERVQAWLPGAVVAKAFNTVFAANQAEPLREGDPTDGFVATDDERVREILFELLADCGFRPIHVGGLARAAALEQMAFLNIRLQMEAKGDWRSAWRLLDPPPAVVGSPAARAVDEVMRQPGRQPAR